MKKSLLLFALLWLLGTGGQAQTELTWRQLTDVEFELQYLKEYDARFMVPTFGKDIQAYDGKEVSITGYIIPLDAANTMFVLSKNPYASCFFCGGAGQETIVELWLKPEAIRRYKLDQRLTFKGVFQLNDTDIDHFNYILKDAEPEKAAK